MSRDEQVKFLLKAFGDKAEWWKPILKSGSDKQINELYNLVKSKQADKKS